MIKAITVCVGYDDILSVTIGRILENVDQLVVVTTPSDEKTQSLCNGLGNVKVLQTESFFAGGAKFRKGLAIEEGFDFIGRDGWILVIDADILLPVKMNITDLRIGNLYSPFRRILRDSSLVNEYMDPDSWLSLNRYNDGEFAGYFQLFHGSDKAIAKKPWYGIDYMNAGGCDSYFECRWKRLNKIRPNFDVLHIGPAGVNWNGRVTGRIDENSR